MVALTTKNGSNGVDIDWEYPAVDDCGGVDADFDNYVPFYSRGWKVD